MGIKERQEIISIVWACIAVCIRWTPYKNFNGYYFLRELKVWMHTNISFHSSGRHTHSNKKQQVITHKIKRHHLVDCVGMYVSYTILHCTIVKFVRQRFEKHSDSTAFGSNWCALYSHFAVNFLSIKKVVRPILVVQIYNFKALRLINTQLLLHLVERFYDGSCEFNDSHALCLFIVAVFFSLQMNGWLWWRIS